MQVIPEGDFTTAAIRSPGVRPDKRDERASVACVNYVRHTPARGLSSAIVRDPKRISATVDRLLHHAHVCQTTGESVRLSQAMAGQGVSPLN
jgi:hypothetical protein